MTEQGIFIFCIKINIPHLSPLFTDGTKPYLIVSSQNELVKGDPSLQHYTAMPLPGVRSMTGLDVHIAENMVYFSDSTQKKIYKVQTDGTNLTEVSSSDQC